MRFLTILFLCFPLLCFGQKAQKGDFSTEFNFSFMDGVTTAENRVLRNTLKGRYFLKDNLVIRVSVGGNMNNQGFGIAVPDSLAGQPSAGVNTRSGLFGCLAGIEKHFSGSEKLSPYIGLEVGYARGFYKEEWTNSNNGKNYFVDYNRKSTSGSNQLMANILLGMDFYVAKKLFIGAEVGLGYNYLQSIPTKYIYTGSNAPQSNPPQGQAVQSSNWIFYAISGLRIGFIF